MEQESSAGVDDLSLSRVLRLAQAALGGFTPGLALIDDMGGWRFADGGADAPISLIQSIAENGVALWLDDCDVAPGVRAFIATPILGADGACAAVMFGCLRSRRGYDNAIASTLGDLAALFSLTLARLAKARALNLTVAALERSREELSAFADTTPISIVMTDREMRVVKASGQWLVNRRLSEDQVIGRSIYEVVPGYRAFSEAYDRVISTGRSFYEDRVKWWREGKLYWMQSAVRPWFDREGQVGGVHIAAHDITEMVEAMDRTKRSEARLKLALEMADMHVFEMDLARGTLEKAGVEERFFATPQTFEDLNADNLSAVHPDHRDQVAVALKRHIEGGAPFNAEFRVNRQDREVWAASVSQIDRNDAGEMVRFTGAMQDITDRKASERALMQAKEDAEAANRAKSTFLATMSHEIRTPLNGVLGMAQAMAADELCPVQRERLDVIRQSGETLLAILNDVLDLSKIEAGKLELEEVEFDIGELAQGAHAAFTAIANKKGLSFDLTVERSARGVYRGDSTRIRQIIYNLVSNGLKFTEQGEVRVVIARAGGVLNVKVSDTGVGIAPERVERLFQKFEQADASTTRQFGGTGLGLSICRELASLMGGAITATSEAGKGATFEVRLPIRYVGAAPAKKRSAPAASRAVAPVVSNGEAAALRVLAAEDNTVNQLVLKTLLHQIGVDPTVVDNGEDAVVAWETETWDLILMDVQMPRMDGPTATRRIRQLEAELGRQRTPIIALTANAMSHQVAEYAAIGMDGFVAKPIEISRLFAAMRDALGEGDETQDAAAA